MEKNGGEKKSLGLKVTWIKMEKKEQTGWLARVKKEPKLESVASNKGSEISTRAEIQQKIE